MQLPRFTTTNYCSASHRCYEHPRDADHNALSGGILFVDASGTEPKYGSSKSIPTRAFGQTFRIGGEVVGRLRAPKRSALIREGFQRGKTYQREHGDDDEEVKLHRLASQIASLGPFPSMGDNDRQLAAEVMLQDIWLLPAPTQEVKLHAEGR